MLFKEIIAVYLYWVSHETWIQNEVLPTVEKGGTYIYRWALNG
jgi:hypothetical protein